MAELLPCPFCGSDEIVANVDYINKRFVVYCADSLNCCPAEMSLGFYDAGLGEGQFIGFDEMEKIIKELTDKWNTRTQKEG